MTRFDLFAMQRGIGAAQQYSYEGQIAIRRGLTCEPRSPKPAFEAFSVQICGCFRESAVQAADLSES
jgi:hypothetical protein